jgi:hypothetical protein
MQSSSHSFKNSTNCGEWISALHPRADSALEN